MKEKEDTNVMKGLRAIIALLPLLLKLVLVFLKYKRITKKRRKVFKRTLKKEGLPEDVVEKLLNDLPELKIRDMLSKKGIGLNFLKTRY